MRDTIDMAREVKMPYDFVTGEPINIEKLKAFEELARADEREQIIAAQPAPEQYTALEQALTRLQKRYSELETKAASQPAVPDAITDRSETPEYSQGWNDCRQAMLAA